MYSYEKNGLLKHLDFLLCDIAVVTFVFILSYAMRHNSIDMESIYKEIVVVLYLTIICWYFIGHSYSGILRRGYLQEFNAVLKSNFVMLFVCMMYIFFAQNGIEVSRKIVITFFVFNTLCFYIARCILKKYIHYKNADEKNKRIWLLISEKDEINAMLNNLETYHLVDVEIAGIVLLDEEDDIIKNGKSIGTYKVVANGNSLREYLRTNVVDEVLVRVYNYDQNILLHKIQVIIESGITVHIDIERYPNGLPNQKVQRIGTSMVMTSAMKVADPIMLFFKRCMDICGGLIGVIFTGIISIVLVPAIKLDSPGPVIFAQKRVGKSGRIFKIYKFRSMYVDAEERKKALMEQNQMKGLMFKMDNDPRITKVGKFIRKTSLDEFPQFFNVLKGDMSLVGTRPPTVDEYEQYELHHKRRLAIKPGLTGLWQVSGRSEIKDFEDVVKLDTQYIMEWSLAEDIRILLRTVKVVLGKEGAK